MAKKISPVFSKFLSTAMIAVLLLLALAPAVQARSELAAACASTYVVQPGDWMAKIARSCGVSYSALLAANPQITTPWLIYPGQVLNIPGSGQVVPVVTISPTSGVAGTTVTAKGAGFPANTILRVGAALSGNDTAGTQDVQTGSDGSFTAQVTIPAGAKVGEQWWVFAAAPGTNIFKGSNVFLVTSAGSQGNYTVRRGDTLRIIAARFGATVNAILAANPQITNPNLIYPGQVLVIPGGTGGIPPTGGSVYYVQAGDTLKKIAARFGATLDALLAANPQIANPNLIYVGQAVKLPAGIEIYVVQRGDTLRKIAEWFGATVAALQSLNPQIANPNLIYVGQVLRVK